MQVGTHYDYDFSTDSHRLYVFLDAPYYSRFGGRHFLQPAVFAPTATLEGVRHPAEPFLAPARVLVGDGLQPSARDFLQAMMDEAWKQGLRPKGFDDHTHELGAVRGHLEDMRALVFKTGKP